MVAAVGAAVASLLTFDSSTDAGSRVSAESVKLSAEAKHVNWLPLTELIRAREVNEQLDADEQADDEEVDVALEHVVAVELVDLGRSSHMRRRFWL